MERLSNKNEAAACGIYSHKQPLFRKSEDHCSKKIRIFFIFDGENPCKPGSSP